MKVYENRRGQIISYIRRAGNFLKIFHLLPAKQAVLSTSFLLAWTTSAVSSLKDKI